MPHEHEHKPWKELERLIATEDGGKIDEYLDTLSPSEIARSISRLEEDIQAGLLTILEPEDAADLIEELPDAQGADIIEDLPVDKAAAIVDEMDSDHRVDLLGDLDESDAEAILQRMDPDEATEARELLKYDEESAGGIMITEYVVYTQDQTVGDVLDDLRTNAEAYADYSIQYAYVTSDGGSLMGVLRLRDLVLSEGTRPIHEIMIVNPVSVLDNTYLDELEHIFDRYPFSGLPVVNRAGRLVGVVMRADAEEAHSERTDRSFMRFSGIIGGEELRTAPVRERATQRLWWLSLNLVRSMVAAWVVFQFEETVQHFILLAAILPVIANVSGCSGNQAVAVSIRELTLGLVNTDDVFRVVRMELAVGLINGAAVGTLLAVIMILFTSETPLFGVVVGLSLGLNAVLAVGLGGAIPLILKRFNIDPAAAASPILTTLVDTLGFLIVLGMTTLVLM